MKNNEDVGPAIRSTLLDIIDNTQCHAQLRLELAAVVDVGDHIVKSIYTLEGNRPLAQYVMKKF